MNGGVCMLIERYTPFVGGSETQCRLLVGALRAHGTPVFVVTRRLRSDSATFEHIDATSVYRLPPSGKGRLWVEFFFSWSSILCIIRHRKDFGILHLHSGTSIAGALVIPVAKILRKKVVVKIATAGDIDKSVIETERGNLQPSLIHRMLNRWINGVLRMADRILCLSKQIQDELLRNGFLADRLVVLPNGVDATYFHPASVEEQRQSRQKNGLSANKRVVLFSGRLIRRKGVDVLLDAWYRLGALRSDAILVLAGSGANSIDSVESELRAMVAKWHLEQSVLFVGEKNDIRELLWAADIFVFPSRREGMSNALLEAMSVGLPIIASAIGGTVDLLENETSGLLFRPDDAGELVEHLKRALTDARLRQAIGRNARSRIEERYSIATLFQQYLTLYESL